MSGVPGLPRFTSRGVHKAILVSQHASGDFVDANYQSVRCIGRGSFGQIELVKDRTSGEKRVCKRVGVRDMPEQHLEQLRREVRILADLDHPHIVRLYEYAEDARKKELILILEHIPGGDCKGLLRRSGGSLEEEVAARLIHQVLVGLSYCHARSVIHRDIKPDNMMLTGAGPWGEPTCKIIDFGLAARAAASRELLGTAEYLAPEMLAQGGNQVEYTAKVDVWAVGVTAVEMLTGLGAFGKPQDFGCDTAPVIKIIQQYQRLEDCEARLAGARGWRSRSKEADRFFRGVLEKDASKRLPAAQAADHAWLSLHQDEPASLTGEMLRSLAAYVSAPPATRCCLFAIAVRGKVPDLDHLGAAFASADADGDGKLSRRELEEAVADASKFWDPEVDVDALMEAANLDHAGGLSYSEFLAACLFSKHDSIDELIDEAFLALDSDRDGWVQVKDIRSLFRERDSKLFEKLPQDRPFNASDWRRCLRSTCAASGGTLAPRGVLGAGAKGFLGGVLDPILAPWTCAGIPRTGTMDGTEENLCLGSPSVGRNYSLASVETEGGDSPLHGLMRILRPCSMS